MIINYVFGDGDDFEYEVDFDKEREALVGLLCQDAKDCLGKLYSEEGAYQMANYVVYQIDVLDALEEYYEDRFEEYFYNEAEEEYRESL